MEITKIEISNFKSIKDSVTLNFNKNKPDVLIGKNGSGKTNILVALYLIFLGNTSDGYSDLYNFYNRSYNRIDFDFKVHIKLSEEEIADILPEITYDEKKSELIAYSSNIQGHRYLQIDRVKSDYIVPEIREKIEKTEQLIEKLDVEIKSYKESLEEYFGRNENRFIEFSSGLTVDWSVSRIEGCVDRVRKGIAELKGSLDYDLDEITSLFSSPFSKSERIDPVKVRFCSPKLSEVEKKHVKVDESGIREEVDRINSHLSKTQNLINDLLEELIEVCSQVYKIADGKWDERDNENKRYCSFVDNVRAAIGRKCCFLPGESSSYYFKKANERENYYTRERTNTILETYLRNVYNGDDKLEKLKSIDELKLSQEERVAFEKYLNENLPTFESEMIKGVSVDDNGNLSIIEESGDVIDINETSEGRRWYFTYYFTKSTLEAGDILILDEPAFALHPSARREIKEDLQGLAEKGVKVIYSTHNSDMIPDDWRCVNQVEMKNGTILTPFKITPKAHKEFRSYASSDIFYYLEAKERYSKSKFKAQITKTVYSELIKKGKVKTISSELGIEERTVYYWRDAEKTISFDNLVNVAIYLNTDLIELIKKCEL